MKTTQQVCIPYPAQPWAESLCICGDGTQFHSDFCLIKDRYDHWHCIGIGGQDGKDDSLFHAVSEKLLGKYQYREKIFSGKIPPPQHMWAPFAIWADEHQAYLYYAHFVPGKSFNLRLLIGKGPGLDHWEPAQRKDFLDGNIVFEQPADRDPCIFWDDSLQVYLMYYAGSHYVRNSTEMAEVICVRQSQDLLHWSEPRTVIEAPPDYTAAESPFVLKRNGLYYLWVSGFDYGRMSLYVSRNPFNFGHPIENRIEEQSGHCPELVEEQGVLYMACAAVASKFGNRPAEHDLMGVFIQEISWREANSAELAKINLEE